MNSTKPPTPLKAIRAKCLDCVCFQPSEVRKCPAKECPLWPFRMGRNPNRAGIGGGKVPAGNQQETVAAEPPQEAAHAPKTHV